MLRIFVYSVEKSNLLKCLALPRVVHLSSNLRTCQELLLMQKAFTPACLYIPSQYSFKYVMTVEKQAYIRKYTL